MFALLISRPNAETEKLITDLGRHQVITVPAANSCAALQSADTRLPDVALLAIELSPEIEAVCQFLNAKKVPIIELLTEAGLSRPNPLADDFVLQPFRASEIAARIRKLIQDKLPPASGDQIICGNLIIDTAKYEVYHNGRLVELTFKEYELLKCLAANPGRVFTRDALLNQVWGEDYFGGDRTVDVHVRRLRGKIEDTGQTYIDTVRNIGYRFKKV